MGLICVLSTYMGFCVNKSQLTFFSPVPWIYKSVSEKYTLYKLQSEFPLTTMGCGIHRDFSVERKHTLHWNPRKILPCERGLRLHAQDRYAAGFPQWICVQSKAYYSSSSVDEISRTLINMRRKKSARNLRGNWHAVFILISVDFNGEVKIRNNGAVKICNKFEIKVYCCGSAADLQPWIFKFLYIFFNFIFTYSAWFCADLLPWQVKHWGLSIKIK